MSKLVNCCKAFFRSGSFTAKSEKKTESSRSHDRHTTASGPDNLFLDAIHDDMDRRTVFGNPSSSISNLRRLIKDKLAPDQRQPDGYFTTGFAAITRTSDNRFRLRAANNQLLDRTDAEIERHILLQSQVRYASQIAPQVDVEPDRGDAICIDAARRATSSATRSGAAAAPSSSTRNGSAALPKTNRPTSPPVVQTIQVPTQRPAPPTIWPLEPGNAQRNVPGNASGILPMAVTSEISAEPLPAAYDPTWGGPSLTNTPASSQGISATRQRNVAKAAFQNPLNTSANTSPNTSPNTPAITSLNMPPNTTQPVEYQDDHGNLITTFTSASVDMNFADQMFMNTTHKVKGISGANGNCWIRGTWLAAMTQHFNDLEGNGLTERLKEKLGPDFYDDAEKAGQMLRAFRDDGIQTIVTGQELANMDADFEKDSYIKLPGKNIDVNGSEGEAVCERLTYALLSRAGMSDAELTACIASNQHGELHHVTTLMRELGGDTVVYGRRWEWDENTAKASFNPAQSVITICAQPESRLKNIEVAPGTTATSALFQEMDVKPLLLHKGGHFEFCIPTICLHGRGKYRWPT